VWKWDQQEPFGVNVPDENPSALGLFEFPLRFPGQYADKETNLYYNYFRDYDPTIGGFIEFDPLGIVPYQRPTRRLNHPFAYTDGDPLSKVDPLGLCACPGGQWTQSANFAFSLMIGGGAQISNNAIFTCASNPSIQCKANVICVGGGLMLSGGIGADLGGVVYGANNSGDLGAWGSGVAGSVGPISGTYMFGPGPAGGGNTLSLMKSFGGGIAYVSCRAYYIKCNCPCP
jgi:RHS repeat-associated protein